MARTSSSTRVMKTMGRLPSPSANRLISRTTSCALSTVSMKGRRTWRGLVGNWARMELPKVSAVMPVPSETKNTERSGMAMAAGGQPAEAAESGHHREELLRIPAFRSAAIHPVPTTGLQAQLQAALAGGSACQVIGHRRTASLRARAHAEAPLFSRYGAFPCLAPLATALVAPFEHLRMSDVETVGGKNASLGEMISQLAASGVRVPGGFATTAHAFRQFLRHGGLDRRASRTSSPRWMSMTCARWPRPAR
jgi:hypothetical protein